VVVLPGQDAESVSTKVEQFSSAVAQAACETVGAGCGISVGVAHYPADGADAEALLAVADQRMYHEKQRGGSASTGADVSGVLV